MVLENLREDPRFESGFRRLFCPFCWYLAWPPLVGSWPSQPILAPGRSGVTVGAEMRNRLPRKGVAGENGGGNADRGNATSAVAGKGLLPNGRAGVGRVLAQPWHTAEMGNRLPQSVLPRQIWLPIGVVQPVVLPTGVCRPVAGRGQMWLSRLWLCSTPLLGPGEGPSRRPGRSGRCLRTPRPGMDGSGPRGGPSAATRTGPARRSSPQRSPADWPVA